MFGMNEIVGRAYFKNAAPNTLTVTSKFLTLQGEGPYSGWPAYFIRLTKCNLACSFCFPANTWITMGDGSKKRIDTVNIGDTVMSYDEQTGDFVPKRVSKLYNSKAQKLIRIRTKIGSTNPGDLVYATPEHPFLVRGKGWVEAQNLQKGDPIIHWTTSDRMKMFNPIYDKDVKATIQKKLNTPENKKRASERLAQLYKDRPELRQARIEVMSGENNPMKDPEIALKAYITREKDRPKTSAENRFEIATQGLPIKFVGHGDLVISHKVPDFVVEGQKKVIEVWASDAQHATNRDKEWQKKRADLFAKEGYETLFVPMPPSGVRNGLYDDIRKNVSEFIHNGEYVEEVAVIEQGSGPAWTRLAGTKHANCDVYNLEVEDTHTYIANDKVVHNCDTYFDSGDVYEFADIFDEIERDIDAWFQGRGMDTPEWAKGKNKRMVLVITGGEPALQTNLTEFLAQANEVFQATQIESNGTLLLDCPGTTYVCSPKCIEKNGVATKYLAPRQEVLDRADCLKFVMCSPEIEKYSPYNTIPDWAHNWAEKTGRPVYVSPMNIYNQEPQKAKELRAQVQGDITIEQRSTIDEVISFWEPGLLNMEANQRNHEYTAEYAMKHGFRLNLQVHLFASLP